MKNASVEFFLNLTRGLDRVHVMLVARKLSMKWKSLRPFYQLQTMTWVLNIHYIEYIIIQIYYFQTHLLYFNGIYKFEGIKDENGTVSETTNSSQPKESFAEIGVYFQSLNKKLVYEEPKYTVSFSFEPRRHCRIAIVGNMLLLRYRILAFISTIVNRINDCRTRRIDVSLPWNIYFHVVWSIWTSNWSSYCNIHVLLWTLTICFKWLNHYSWYDTPWMYKIYFNCTFADEMMSDVIFNTWRF